MQWFKQRSLLCYAMQVVVRQDRLCCCDEHWENCGRASNDALLGMMILKFPVVHPCDLRDFPACVSQARRATVCGTLYREMSREVLESFIFSRQPWNVSEESCEDKQLYTAY
jgi:hypothetical protein